MSGDEDRSLISMNRADYVAAASRSVLGIVPFAGSLLVEIADAVIPGQRMDRIAKFALELEQRIAGLEDRAPSDLRSDEEFTDLVEESLRQAARSLSDARRAQLAELVASSLGGDDITHAESKHFMRILGELNDIEVIRLGWHQYEVSGTGGQYYATHRSLLEEPAPTTGYPQQAIDKQTVFESYDAHLVQLGLYDGHRLTNLGRLFCLHIGILDAESA